MATGELAKQERLKPQSVTRLVAALVARRLAERVVDDADRRRLLVAITARGKQHLAREMQRRDDRLARSLAVLSNSDRAVLRAACLLIERLSEGSGMT